MPGTMEAAVLTSVAARFAETTPEEFGETVADLWRVADRIRQAVEQSVSEELIPPTTGCGILACASAQLFGYAEFTGAVNPSPLSAPLWAQASDERPSHQ